MTKNLKAAQFLLLPIFLAGLGTRLALLLSDLPTLVQFVPDDAFYYLETARNAVRGYGITFDGIHMTNGFHPLWLALILPLAAIAQDLLVFLRSVLLTAVVFDLIGAWLLCRLLAKITGLWLALAGVALYYLPASAARTALNGLETSLSSLLFISSLYLALLLLERDRVPNRQIVLTGVTFGLLFLARTDNAFYLVTLVAMTALGARSIRGLASRLVLLFSALLVVIPWVAWNWMEFRTLLQSSGDAIPYALQANFLDEGHPSITFVQRGLAVFLVFLSTGLPSTLGFPIVVFQTTLVFCILVFVRRRGAVTASVLMNGLVRTVIALWIAGLGLIAVHTIIRWYPRPWYFEQLRVLSIITLCATASLLGLPAKIAVIYESLLSRIPRQFPKSTAFIGVLVLIAATAAFWIGRVTNEPDYPWQVEMLDAAEWVKTHVGIDECAGAFNSGVIAFLSERCVVNLDGAINNAARDAIMNRNLFAMMRNSGVRYYLDYDPIMLQQYRAFLGVERDRLQMLPIAEIHPRGGGWFGDAIRIYSIDWAE